jgi:hypothetical protein
MLQSILSEALFMTLTNQKQKAKIKQSSRNAPGLSTEVLDQIVERLVALASPSQIILFGSNARGEA